MTPTDRALYLPARKLRFDIATKAWRSETRLDAIKDAKSFAVDEHGHIWAALDIDRLYGSLPP